MSRISRSIPSAKSCSNAASSAASVSPRSTAFARRLCALCRALLKDMSAPPGNGCVGASILPREAVGTQAQHAAQNRISLALANHYPVGSPLWHLFNNFYRHTVHKADCAANLHEEVMHD